MTTRATRRCPHLRDYHPFALAYLADSYPVWAHSRNEEPLFHIPLLNAWGVTRYDDVLEVLRDPVTYSSAKTLDVIGFRDEWQARVDKAFPPAYPGLINNDPPRHSRVRKLVQKAFTRHAVAAREAEIRSLADELIDSFASRGRAEIMHEYAAPFSIKSMSVVLGLPLDMWPQLKQWADEDVQLLNPTLEDDLRREYTDRSADWFSFLDELIQQRQAHPREDLISALISGQVDGEPALSTREIIAVAAQLIVGGHETVNNQIGLTFLQLLEHPTVLAEVSADTDLVPAVIEEAIRRRAPVRGLPRVTTREVELGGKRLPPGTHILVLFASANRDEQRFADPDAFDIHRPDIRQHLAFGRGTHFCVGDQLARLEARVTLEQFLARLPGLRLVPGQELGYVPSFIMQGLLALELEWNGRTET
jgi:cytochrome P450